MSDEANPPITVFLLDDHDVVRQGLRSLLEAKTAARASPFR